MNIPKQPQEGSKAKSERHRKVDSFTDELDLKRASAEDERAKENGALIGRIVYPPFREGEGHMYQVTDEHERGVELTHISGVLPLPQWGKRTWLTKTTFLPYLEAQDQRSKRQVAWPAKGW